MSLSLEEQAPDIRAAQDKKSAEKEFSLKAAVAEGFKAKELIADPRWQSYVSHLEAMANQAEKLVTRYQKDLVEKVITGDEYIKIKLSYTSAVAHARAYGHAIKLVEALINQGDNAAAELAKGLTKD